MKRLTARVVPVLAILLSLTSVSAQRLMESLGRGVVAVNEGPAFSTNDILDLPALTEKLRRHDDAFGQFLAGRLSEHSLRALTNSTVPRARLTELLQDDLNATIQQGESIYSAQRFSNIVLSAEAEALRTNALDADQTLRLNRLMLADALPRVLARPKG